MGWLPRAVLLCSLWLCAAPAAAAAEMAPLRLSAGASQLPLSGHYHLWHDASGALSLAQMITRAQQGSAPRLEGGVAPAVGHGGAFWLQLPLVVERGAPDWLVLDAPWVEQLDVYVTATAQATPVWQRHTGLQRPAEQRDLAVSAIALHMPLPAGEYTLWIRAAGAHALTVEGAFWQLPTFTEHYLRERGTLLALAGLMLAMGLFGVFGGMVMRAVALRSYGLYAIGTVCIGLFGSGALVPLLPLPHEFSARFAAVAACLTMAVGNRAVVAIFRLAQHRPLLASWLHGLGHVLVGAALIAALGYYLHAVVMLVVIAAMLTSGVLGIVAALPALRQPYRLAALLYLLGMVLFGAPLFYAQVYQLSGLHISFIASPLNPGPAIGTLTRELLRAGHLLLLLLAVVIWCVARHRRRRNAGIERQRLAHSSLAEHGAHMAERNLALKNALHARQEAERQLAEALGEQRSFLAMVSHEFRTPLSVIGLIAHNLQRRHGNDPHTREDIARVKRANRRLISLVEACLSNDWLDNATLQLNARRCDLAPLLAELCEQRRIVTGRQIELILPQAPLWVRIDTVLVQMVFDNLLDNAIKYAPAPAPIQVQARHCASGVVEVTFSDGGPGIAAPERSRIFERHYRSPTVLRKGGNGLGLYLVRRVMALHGGDVWLDNRYQAGARFVVRFPPADAQRAPATSH